MYKHQLNESIMTHTKKSGLFRRETSFTAVIPASKAVHIFVVKECSQGILKLVGKADKPLQCIVISLVIEAKMLKITSISAEF